MLPDDVSGPPRIDIEGTRLLDCVIGEVTVAVFSEATPATLEAEEVNGEIVVDIPVTEFCDVVGTDVTVLRDVDNTVWVVPTTVLIGWLVFIAKGAEGRDGGCPIVVCITEVATLFDVKHVVLPPILDIGLMVTVLLETDSTLFIVAGVLILTTDVGLFTMDCALVPTTLGNGTTDFIPLIDVFRDPGTACLVVLPDAIINPPPTAFVDCKMLLELMDVDVDPLISA